MNTKVLTTLEYTKIIDLLTEKADSEPGKKLCRELVPSTDLSAIRTAQRETKDALARLFRIGSTSFGSNRDLGFSIRSLEIGSSLSMSELLKLASFLDNVSRIKTYGKKEREDLPNDSLDAYFEGSAVRLRADAEDIAAKVDDGTVYAFFYQKIFQAVCNIAFGNGAYIELDVIRGKCDILTINGDAVGAAQGENFLDICIIRSLRVFCCEIPERGQRRNGDVKGTVGLPGDRKSLGKQRGKVLGYMPSVCCAADRIWSSLPNGIGIFIRCIFAVI